MITNDDLQKIGNLIDERLDAKLGEILEQKFEQKLAPIKKDLKKIKITLDETFSLFDHHWDDHEKRIQKLEKTVNIPTIFN